MKNNVQFLTEQDITRLISSLCELLATKKKSSRHCDGNLLLQDPVLRDKTLRDAAKSEDHQVRKIAYKLLRVDFEEFISMKNKSTLSNSGDNNSHSIKNDTNVNDSSKVNQLKWLIFGLSIALFVSLIFVLKININNLLNDEIKVNHSITQDSVWTSDVIYILENIIHIENNATLTIEAGTIIKGKSGAALLVTRGAKLIAKGNIKNPIVFTSHKETGKRQRGDWGGGCLIR